MLKINENLSPKFEKIIDIKCKRIKIINKKIIKNKNQMKSILKFLCLFLLCISKVYNATCPSETVDESKCDTDSCTFSQTAAATCTAPTPTPTCTGDEDACKKIAGCTFADDACKVVTCSGTTKTACATGCTFTEAKGTCKTKSADSNGSTSNNNTKTDGAFGLKSYLFAFLSTLLF